MASDAPLAVAESGGQVHHVIGLWSVRLRDELRQALVMDDIRQIARWTSRYHVATAHWPTTPLDPFYNANTVDDVDRAEALANLDDD